MARHHPSSVLTPPPATHFKLTQPVEAIVRALQRRSKMKSITSRTKSHQGDDSQRLLPPQFEASSHTNDGHVSPITSEMASENNVAQDNPNLQPLSPNPVLLPVSSRGPTSLPPNPSPPRQFPRLLPKPTSYPPLSDPSFQRSIQNLWIPHLESRTRGRPLETQQETLRFLVEEKWKSFPKWMREEIAAVEDEVMRAELHSMFLERVRRTHEIVLEAWLEVHPEVDWRTGRSEARRTAQYDGVEHSADQHVDLKGCDEGFSMEEEESSRGPMNEMEPGGDGAGWSGVDDGDVDATMSRDGEEMDWEGDLIDEYTLKIE